MNKRSWHRLYRKRTPKAGTAWSLGAQAYLQCSLGCANSGRRLRRPAAVAPVVISGGRLSQLLRGDLRAGGPPGDPRPSRVEKSLTFGPLGWAGQSQAVTSPAPQTDGHHWGRPGQGAGVPGLEWKPSEAWGRGVPEAITLWGGLVMGSPGITKGSQLPATDADPGAACVALRHLAADCEAAPSGPGAPPTFSPEPTSRPFPPLPYVSWRQP